MKELKNIVQERLKDKEFLKLLNSYANKLYFYSAGNWTSRNFLIDKIIKKTYSAETITRLSTELDFMLLALILSNKAISKQEADGITRYKITGDPTFHLKFLEEEEKFLVERLEYIRNNIDFFKKQLSRENKETV